MSLIISRLSKLFFFHDININGKIFTINTERIAMGWPFDQVYNWKERARNISQHKILSFLNRPIIKFKSRKKNVGHCRLFFTEQYRRRGMHTYNKIWIYINWKLQYERQKIKLKKKNIWRQQVHLRYAVNKHWNRYGKGN